VVVVVMGVSGAGKTTIGAALAARLGWAFIDADDQHPSHNIAKMAAGQALDDADRRPWLERLNRLLWQYDARDAHVVLACSALKERYRRQLADGVRRVEWVYLQGGFELLQERIASRRHRYMPASLLGSQLEALEPPQRAIVVDVSAAVADCVAAIVARLPDH
jgi:gluconokinase